MRIFKKMLFHYFCGLLSSVSIVLFIVVFDYYINDYLVLPNILNFISVCLISGIFFGFSAFAWFEIGKYKINK